MSGSGDPGPALGAYWKPHPWRAVGLWRFAPAGERAGIWRILFPGVWLLYLIPMVAGAFGHRHNAAYLAGAIILVVVFAAVYIAMVGWWDRWPLLAALPGLGLLYGMAAFACLVYGKGAGPLWIYVAVAGGTVIGSQWAAMRVIAGAAVCYSAFTLAGHVSTGDFLSGMLPLLFGGLAALAFRVRLELSHELIRARETVAELAASEERLRLARDMHDLTGQSLSMITLKSELAARLLDRLPASPERDRATREITQVADVSRQALADIREAISGYRRPTLAVEASTARSALDAAGITAHDDIPLVSSLGGPSGTVDADAEAALAWCLREAVTNVVRHSCARNCWLTLRAGTGELTLEVRDDGRGAQPNEAAGSTGHSGLHGMSERLSAVGGRLEIRPGTAGFCVLASVPVAVPAPAEARPG
jgi:two-component system sensor histidine kinase DesK